LKRLKRHPDSRSVIWKISVFLLVLSVIFVALIVYLVFFTDFFTVKKIHVTGVSRLDKDYVKKLTGSGLKQSIFTLNVHRIESNLKTNPWIEKADISRALPDTLRVRVHERVVCAVIDIEGVRFAVDSGGYVLDREKNKEYAGYPALKNAAVKTPTVGTYISDSKARKCFQVIAGLPGPIKKVIKEAYFSTIKGTCLKINFGWGAFELIYGTPEESKLKNEMLLAVISDIEANSRKVKYVDVRVPEAPVIRE